MIKTYFFDTITVKENKTTFSNDLFVTFKTIDPPPPVGSFLYSTIEENGKIEIRFKVIKIKTSKRNDTNIVTLIDTKHGYSHSLYDLKDFNPLEYLNEQVVWDDKTKFMKYRTGVNTEDIDIIKELNFYDTVCGVIEKPDLLYMYEENFHDKDLIIRVNDEHQLQDLSQICNEFGYTAYYDMNDVVKVLV